MIVLCGKSSSGKNAVCAELEKLGFKRVVTYTTRPMRKGEKQNVTYHFISDVEFQEKIYKGFFAEWKAYDTVEGTWYYGSAKEDYINTDEKTIIILTPDGYKDVVKNLGFKPCCIYLYANNATIDKRLSERGDDKFEAVRRIRHDNEDFRHFEDIADRIVYNNTGSDLRHVAETIAFFIPKWEKEKKGDV